MLFPSKVFISQRRRGLFHERKMKDFKKSEKEGLIFLKNFSKNQISKTRP
jgi:predicted GIY-YIG superfamily endonuclease